MRCRIHISNDDKFYIIEKMLGKKFIDFIENIKSHSYLTFNDITLLINKSKSKFHKNIKLIFKISLINYYEYKDKNIFSDFYNILSNYKNVKLKIETHKDLITLKLSFNLNLEDLLDILFNLNFFSIINNNKKFEFNKEEINHIDKRKIITYSIKILNKSYKIKIKVEDTFILKDENKEDLHNKRFILISLCENDKSLDYYNNPNIIMANWSKFNENYYYIDFYNMLYDKPKKEFEINIEKDKNNNKINKEVIITFFDRNENKKIENLNIDITKYKLFDRIIDTFYPLEIIKYIIEEDDLIIINKYLEIYEDINFIISNFDLITIL